MTVLEYLWQHARASAEKWTVIDSLRQSEWSVEFERFMRNRLVTGALRYAPLHGARAKKFNSVAEAIRHLKSYLIDGNLEHLVDAANLCMGEYVHPECVSNSCWHAGDDTHHAEEI